MHCCLQIRELQDLILSHYNTDPHGDAQVLARLGRTCKTFHDSAMDVLWRELHDFIEILRCIPSGLFDVVPSLRKRERVLRLLRPIIYSDWDRVLRLLRPIIYSDWDRVLVYARRVKMFSAHRCLGDPFCFSEIFPALKQTLPTDCFFPNLVELRWNLFEEAECKYSGMFIGPRITSISTCRMPTNYSPSLLSAVSLKCRPLKKVKIVYDEDQDMDDHCRTSLSAFILHLSAVESLSIHLPDVPSLQHLSRLETLRELHLPTLSVIIAPCSPRSPAEPSSFLNLTQLIVWGLGYDAAASLISMCSNSPLGTLSLHFRKSALDGASGMFYEALALCYRSHTSLHFLSLRGVLPDGDSLLPDIVWLRNLSLQNLFCFGILTEIELEFPLGFELTDALCARMASAWPHTKRLTLGEFYSPPTPTVTLECLHSFAKHCPMLFSLHITLDARVVPQLQPSEEHTKKIVQTTLQHLNVGYSLIDSSCPRPIGRFLGSVFPKLKYIATAADRSSHDPEAELGPDQFAWRKAEELLPARSEIWRG
ncbi:hypothetical protein DFH06DRAFT_1467221 [Mycena polygramma]|nr:hypothetical protein DFH06DRAFT_1467221 [Mycena polygramma]